MTTNWRTMTSRERRQEIMEQTGAEEWEWIEDLFGGRSVTEIEEYMNRWFDWNNSYELAKAIHRELN